MKPDLIAHLKQRFKKIKEIEDLEIKKISLKEKLQQLVSLISLAFGMGISLSKGRKTQMVGTNWALLKSTK